MKVNATFYYVNETSQPVYIAGRCGFDNLNDFNSSIEIPPEDSVMLQQTNRTYEGRLPNINNYGLYPSGSCQAIYGDSIKCSGGLGDFWNIDKYEKRTKTSKNSFKFTYRFTDETMAAAHECE